jgi:hypothetical protein
VEFVGEGMDVVLCLVELLFEFGDDFDLLVGFIGGWVFFV